MADFLEVALWVTLVAGAILIFYVIYLSVSINKKRIEQLQRYWNVEIGMPEYRMLSIMGDGYNRSLLKNNRVKYEWRINASSYGSSYKGFSTRSYSGVKKVTIYVKNGLVEEVKPYNV